MSYFLIVYDRPSGKQIELREFDSREEAIRARFEREVAELDRDNLEVMVLGASSLDALKKTHARYFKSIEQLAAG